MFYTIRIIFSILSLLLIIYAFKSKKIKKYTRTLVIGIVIILGLFDSVVQLDVVLLRFPSLQSAYEYRYKDKNVASIIELDDISIVSSIGQNAELTHTAFKKEDNKWKILRLYFDYKIDFSFKELLSVNLIESKLMNKKVLFVKKSELSDIYDKEILTSRGDLPSQFEYKYPQGYTVKMLYFVVDAKSTEYTLIIDGEKVTISL